MKYIKKFEQLNINDYVIFPKDYNHVRKNYPYQIVSFNDRVNDRVYFIDDKGKEKNFNFNVIDFKKISQEEAEQLLLNNKYNL